MLSKNYPINTKRKFVRLYKQGIFGNASPTWDTLEEWLDGFNQHGRGLFHIRNRVAGRPTYYNLSSKELEYRWHSLACHVDPTSLYISEMAPHEVGTIQGEIQRTFRGLELYWTSASKPMREAFEYFGGATWIGLVAKLYLQKYMDPASYEWLEYLLDAYPDHVIEFSCFERNWGTIPGRNTVWWEVRAY